MESLDRSIRVRLGTASAASQAWARAWAFYVLTIWNNLKELAPPVYSHVQSLCRESLDASRSRNHAKAGAGAREGSHTTNPTGASTFPYCSNGIREATVSRGTSSVSVPSVKVDIRGTARRVSRKGPCCRRRTGYEAGDWIS